ncbi:MAG: hypothetical protein R3B84_06225 [Zavarzinella sp.]
MRSWLIALLLLLGESRIIFGCSYCDPAFRNRRTIREDAVTCRAVVIGYLDNPQIIAEKGSTDLVLTKVLKAHEGVTDKRTITLPKWIPFDPKAPPIFLVFIDQYEGKIDPFRGEPLSKNSSVEYLQEVIASNSKDSVARLEICFRYLDHPDKTIAQDAFLEFAKSSDGDVIKAAKRFDLKKLRSMLLNKETPNERLSLYAFLLGQVGTKEDVQLLEHLLERSSTRTTAMLTGALAALIQLDANRGWQVTQTMLQESQRPYEDILAILSMMRYTKNFHEKEYQEQLTRTSLLVLSRSDLADIIIEDLRNWKYWNHTELILRKYGQQDYQSPIVKSAIIRYALSCPEPLAVQFVKKVQAQEPELVAEISQLLKLEK